MATAPTTTSFQPFFKRVSQGDERHADIYAVLAMLIPGKSLTDIRQQAETMGIPRIGPYYTYAIDGDFLARLCAAHGLVCTIWKACSRWDDVADVSIALVDYSDDWELGRAVLFHRMKSPDGKAAQAYLIDPWPHADARSHMRVGGADLMHLKPSWFIGVTPMAAKPAKK